MSDGHSWVKHEREGWTVCAICGLVRNYDRPESQCRGAVKVALREATGGEQGETAEIVRLRRERIDQEAVNLEMGGELAKLNLELAEIGGAFAQSEQYREAVERERDEAVDALARCRTAAQILIAEIGASGPEDIEETARRAAEVIRVKSDLLEGLDRARVVLRGMIDSLETRDPATLREIEAAWVALEGDQKKSDLLQDLAAVRVALRDLINACENTRPSHIPTPVVAAIEAARAVLGEDGS